MQPISFSSRDGLTIHGYLTLPKGVAAKNLPTVLVVHGGPWARDTWGYDPEVQFLANRGFAMILFRRHAQRPTVAAPIKAHTLDAF
jgi:dipeptidyl aminopeptidase/acylaminoacyl peptidase